MLCRHDEKRDIVSESLPTYGWENIYMVAYNMHAVADVASREGRYELELDESRWLAEAARLIGGGEGWRLDDGVVEGSIWVCLADDVFG